MLINIRNIIRIYFLSILRSNLHFPPMLLNIRICLFSYIVKIVLK
nr:MAG TPA: hypothetical protein [Bacteriophage sp.]